MSGRRLLARLAAICAALFLWHPAEAGAAHFAGERIVAVGDVHGNLANFKAVLLQSGIIDSGGNWAGGRSMLVQTGDLLDRGPDDRAVLDFMMRLEAQADQAGGRVVSLIGNHESMNLLGDLRYVSGEAFASFADDKSPKRQEKYLKRYKKFQKKRARRLGLEEPEFGEQWETQWRAKHPVGFVEHREALASDGEYGKWLRERKVAVQIGRMIFLHGGISPSLSEFSLDEINKQVAREIEAFDNYRRQLARRGVILKEFTLREFFKAVKAEFKYQASRSASDVVSDPRYNSVVALSKHREYLKMLQAILKFNSWYVASPLGPLWFRGYAKWSDAQGNQLIGPVADAYGVENFVVGHTPQLGQGPTARFGGRVVLIDTGLNSDYYRGGRPSALEIRSGTFTAIYTDGSREILIEPAPEIAHESR